MKALGGKISSIGIACVICYLVPELMLVGRVVFFPTTHGSEWFWAFSLTFPWVKLTTAFFENIGAELISAIILTSLTCYAIGHLLDRVYYGKRTLKSSR